MCLDCTGVYGLHMSPSRGMLSATQNWRKKQHIKSTHAFTQNMWNFMKFTSKMCPNGCLYFGGGASWGTFGAPVCFLTRKVHPKCSKSAPTVAKLTPKVVPSAPKVTPRLQIGPQNVVNVTPKARSNKKGPADCAKRLQLPQTWLAGAWTLKLFFKLLFHI